MVRPEQVLHVARLAKLRLSAEEEGRLGLQFTRILEYVEQLKELDDEAADRPAGSPEGAPPEGADPARERPLRPDEPCDPLPRAAVLRGAPSSDGEMFRVPPALAEDDGDGEEGT